MTEPHNNELSRIVRLDQIDRLDANQQIDATAEECAALTRRFGFASLDRLEARYSLTRQGNAILGEGRLTASLAQPCTATGEPVPEQIDTPFSILFVPEGEEQLSSGDELEIDVSQADIASFSDDRIDMGEAMAETLALAVTPFPRAPGADEYLRKMGVISEEQASPFAVLAQLKKD
jgi:uncharacterized metal-binding protein YceD (DUF177 family)